MRHLTSVHRGLCVIACALAACLSAPERAHAEASIGPHAGINFDWEEVLIGGEARIDVAVLSPNVQLQLDPALTLAFLGGGVALDFSFNVPFQFILRDSSVRPFTGPGLALVHFSGDRNSDTELFFNILGGVLFDLGDVDPFVQLKVMIPHGSMAELLGGVLFAL